MVRKLSMLLFQFHRWKWNCRLSTGRDVVTRCEIGCEWGILSDVPLRCTAPPDINYIAVENWDVVKVTQLMHICMSRSYIAINRKYLGNILYFLIYFNSTIYNTIYFSRFRDRRLLQKSTAHEYNIKLFFGNLFLITDPPLWARWPCPRLVMSHFHG